MFGSNTNQSVELKFGKVNIFQHVEKKTLVIGEQFFLNKSLSNPCDGEQFFSTNVEREKERTEPVWWFFPQLSTNAEREKSELNPCGGEQFFLNKCRERKREN